MEKVFSIFCILSLFIACGKKENDSETTKKKTPQVQYEKVNKMTLPLELDKNFSQVILVKRNPYQEIFMSFSGDIHKKSQFYRKHHFQTQVISSLVDCHLEEYKVEKRLLNTSSHIDLREYFDISFNNKKINPYRLMEEWVEFYKKNHDEIIELKITLKSHYQDLFQTGVVFKKGIGCDHNEIEIGNRKFKKKSLKQEVGTLDFKGLLTIDFDY